MSSFEWLRELVLKLPWRVVILDQGLKPIYTNRRANLSSPCWRVRHGFDAPCWELGRECPVEMAFATNEVQTDLHVHEDERGITHLEQVIAVPLCGDAERPQMVALITSDVSKDRWAQARLDRLTTLLEVFPTLGLLRPEKTMDCLLTILSKVANALDAESFAFYVPSGQNHWELGWQKALPHHNAAAVFQDVVKLEEPLAQAVCHLRPEVLDPASTRGATSAFTRKDVRIVLLPLAEANKPPHLAAFATAPWKPPLPTEVMAALSGLIHTYRAILEAESRQQEVEKNRRAEELRAFAAGIAHDLGNTLEVLLLALQGACDRMDEALRQRLLASVKQAAELASNLRSYSQTGALPREKVVLGELLRELQPFFENLLGEKLRLEDDDPLGLCVLGNRIQLKQVLSNLVVNAAEAIGSTGTVTVEILHEAEGSRAGKPSPHDSCESLAGFAVTDTGRGIPPEDLPFIFEPTFSKHKARKSGLGLAVVKKIVEEHSGILRVHSEPGKGSRFEVLFPALPSPTVSPTGSPVARSRMEAVLLEDDAVLGPVVRDLLARAFRGVTLVRSLAELEEMLAQRGSDKTVLVADRCIGGTDVLSAVMGLARKHNLAAVLWTGNVEDVPASFPGAVVPKPSSVDELLEAIDRLLKSHD